MVPGNSFLFFLSCLFLFVSGCVFEDARGLEKRERTKNREIEGGGRRKVFSLVNHRSI